MTRIHPDCTSHRALKHRPKCLMLQIESKLAACLTFPFCKYIHVCVCFMEMLGEVNFSEMRYSDLQHWSEDELHEAVLDVNRKSFWLLYWTSNFLWWIETKLWAQFLHTDYINNVTLCMVQYLLRVILGPWSWVFWCLLVSAVCRTLGKPSPCSDAYCFYYFDNSSKNYSASWTPVPHCCMYECQSQVKF